MSILNSLPTSIPAPQTDQGLRVCQILGVKEDKLAEYKEIHKQVWPAILNALRRAKIVDYSIHHTVLPFGPEGPNKPQNILIANMRYMGDRDDFEKDMAKIAEDPETKKWWQLTDPLQTSFVPGATGSESGPGWWTVAEEVFRFEG